MGKVQETVEALQNMLDDLGCDDELMDLYGEALRFAIKCVKYTERNRWHDYNKEKPENGEPVVYEILEIATYYGVAEYVENEGFVPGGELYEEEGKYGDEEHVYWKPYYNDSIEEDDVNSVQAKGKVLERDWHCNYTC